MQHRLGIYPGTFDPVTLGHLDIIERASKLVDTLIVGVAAHSNKEKTLFSLEERVHFIESCVKDRLPNVVVEPLPGLLIAYAKQKKATAIFRGLRAVSDFDYEFQMAMMNARLNDDIETVFLMASETHQFVASRLVKEVARLGGDVRGFVPSVVAEALAHGF
jgi:pantetheine-phosphate adenylyltransferase